MGDVVLLVPVIKSLIAAYPDVEVTVVTRPKFASFFTDIERVIPFPADVDYTYNGVFGMRELFRKLFRRASYEVVIDVHDHIRTIMLRTFFKLFGTRVVVFDKGRSEKKKFSRKENKDTTPLPHTVERYRRAFEKAGFPFEIQAAPALTTSPAVRHETETWLQQQLHEKDCTWIGIAPFAMHTSKIWPLQNYSELIREIIQKEKAHFFFFGGGQKEIDFFTGLKNEFPAFSHIVAGQLKIKQEIALMQKLDLMICVDSSNMHLAALGGTRLLSIWGGTHPDVGFAPYGQAPDSVLQISRDELPCIPCSVYGREKCYRGDFACLNRITPAAAADRVFQLLHLERNN